MKRCSITPVCCRIFVLRERQLYAKSTNLTLHSSLRLSNNIVTRFCICVLLLKIKLKSQPFHFVDCHCEHLTLRYKCGCGISNETNVSDEMQMRLKCLNLKLGHIFMDAF